MKNKFIFFTTTFLAVGLTVLAARLLLVLLPGEWIAGKLNETSLAGSQLYVYVAAALFGIYQRPLIFDFFRALVVGEIAHIFQRKHLVRILLLVGIVLVPAVSKCASSLLETWQHPTLIPKIGNERDLFDPKTGSPRCVYYKSSDGTIVLYFLRGWDIKFPCYDPKTGVLLAPASTEIVEEAQLQYKKAQEEANKIEIIPPANTPAAANAQPARTTVESEELPKQSEIAYSYYPGGNSASTNTIVTNAEPQTPARPRCIPYVNTAGELLCLRDGPGEDGNVIAHIAEGEMVWFDPNPEPSLMLNTDGIPCVWAWVWHPRTQQWGYCAARLLGVSYPGNENPIADALEAVQQEGSRPAIAPMSTVTYTSYDYEVAY